MLNSEWKIKIEYVQSRICEFLIQVVQRNRRKYEWWAEKFNEVSIKLTSLDDLEYHAEAQEVIIRKNK